MIAISGGRKFNVNTIDANRILTLEYDKLKLSALTSGLLILTMIKITSPHY